MAVKVQRPNLHHIVIRDIYILRLGVCTEFYLCCEIQTSKLNAIIWIIIQLFQLGLLKKIAKRKSDLRLYADELGKGLVGELDYTLEAANAEEFMVLYFICLWAELMFPAKPS